MASTLPPQDGSEARVCAGARGPRSLVVYDLPIAKKAESIASMISTIRAKFIAAVSVVIQDFSNKSVISVEVPRSKEDENKTVGLAFIELDSIETATMCANACPEFSITSTRIVPVALMSDLLKSDEQLEMEKEANAPPMFTTSENRWYLKDEQQREQLLLRHKENTEIFWFDPVAREPVLCNNGESVRALQSGAPWTQGEAFWSIQGSYLVTLHKRGVSLWGGPEFTRKIRLVHGDVCKILFSPNEEFAVTWNGTPPDAKLTDACKVWKIREGRCLKEFPTPERAPDGSTMWPLFHWSFDSKHLLRTSPSHIYVYSISEDFKVIEPQSGEAGSASLKATNSVCAFSPASDILSVWTPPESSNLPGRLTLYSISTMERVSQKILFSVEAEGRVYWQSRGEYVALRTKSLRKIEGKGKRTIVQLEIFRMTEKNLPVDTVQIEEEIVNLWWEKNSNRFCVLSERRLRFYEVTTSGAQKTTQFVGEIAVPREINTVKWSPLGSNFVAGSCAVEDSSGLLIFGSIGEGNKVDIAAKDEHPKLRRIEWDPTGRFVCTVVNVGINSATGYKLSADTGIMIWSFQGRLLYRKSPIEYLNNFQWRPHPPSLLTAEKMAEIKTRMREFSKKFDIDDERKRSEKRAAKLAERDAIINSLVEEMQAGLQTQMQNPKYQQYLTDRQTFEEQQGYYDTFEEIEDIISVVNVQVA